MKRIKLNVAKTMTFKDGCELYLLDCRQRNLREATINHYRQSCHKVMTVGLEKPVS